MPPSRTILLAAALASATALSIGLGAAPVRASAFCEVLDTPDGFVALREAPNAGAGLVEKMNAGDEVMLLPEKSGAWVRVRFWRAGERLKEGGFDRFQVGWVNGRFLDVCG
jgi:hypothetical protein